MKFVLKTFLALAALTFTLSACNDDDRTYAKDLADEKKLIADFIERNNIKVVETMPEVWEPNVFYKTKSGLYFRLNDIGNTSDTIEAGDKVSFRFLQYTLNEVGKADTIRNLSPTDFSSPSVFNYADLTQVSAAWQEAVGLMKHLDSEATIIVRSKLNFETYGNTVTPMGYDLIMRFQK